jgi:predicted RNA-binding Zn-ribbon protein involved in translation (DUF1610 family)
MIKFHCGQCGHRIAIQKRQLGAIIVCPDCGDNTHPVAEQVIKRRAAVAKKTTVETPATPHACANCTQPIGKLQKLHLWDNRVICAQCHATLSRENSAQVRSAPATEIVPVTARRRSDARTVIDDADPVVQHLARPFRGGLFGALVGLCVAGAALYGTLSLLRDVAGIITGLAIGGLALLLIYVLLRVSMNARGVATPRPRER